MKSLLFTVFLIGCASLPAVAGKVEFAKDGSCRIDGKPFFPIGVWTYGLNPDVLADIREHRFNTLVGNGFTPADLPLIEKHGLMCIPPGSDEWVAAAEKSPSMLAWYLDDEPEEHNVKPEDLRKKYEALKAKTSRDHPIGVTHNQLIGPGRYKGSSEFTMTDVYPVTAKRDWPLDAVGQYAANPRTVNGDPWTVFTFIQTFGGPESDGGLWAQPLPHEVRFMAFNALVHRVNGIFYFSYWPRAATTWASVSDLNRDIERLVPWLLAPGDEVKVSSSDSAVEVRAKKIGDASWMILATNGLPKPARSKIKVASLGDAALTMPFEPGRSVNAKAGEWSERFGAHDVKVYLVGAEPEMPE